MFPTDLTFSQGGFACAIVDETLNGTFVDEGGTTSNCSFFCKWSDLVNFNNWLLNANGFSISGYQVEIGAAHPVFIQHYCHKTTCKPIGNPTSANSWTFARIDAEYKPQEFVAGSPVLIREDSIEISGDVLTIPTDSNFSGLTISGTPTGNSDTLFIPMLTYGVRLFGCTTLPLSSVVSCMNTVNSNAITIKLGPANTLSVPAGYALYLGIDPTSRTISTTGASKFELQHRWLISPIPHNYVLDTSKISGSTTITVPFGTALSGSCFSLPDQPKYKSADHSVLGV